MRGTQTWRPCGSTSPGASGSPAEQARLLATRIAHLHDIKALTSQLRTIADEEVARALPAVACGDLPATALDSSRLAAIRRGRAVPRRRTAIAQRRTGAEPGTGAGPGATVAAGTRRAAARAYSGPGPARTGCCGQGGPRGPAEPPTGSAAAIDAANLGRYPFPAWASTRRATPATSKYRSQRVVHAADLGTAVRAISRWPMPGRNSCAPPISPASPASARTWPPPVKTSPSPDYSAPMSAVNWCPLQPLGGGQLPRRRPGDLALSAANARAPDPAGQTAG